jgi:drug/metabolite transporter (DMT)-like permease
MAWIFVAAAGQFVNAIVAILDKYIVSDERVLPRPFVYAFYSCLITGGWVFIFALGLIPGIDRLGVPQFSNIQTPTIQVVGMAFLAGYTFFMALVGMYTALKQSDASDVMPVIGAVSALSTFGMSYLFLDATLTPNFIWGIVLLSIGTFLVSEMRLKGTTIMLSIQSGVFFSLHYITLKGLFLETSFDDGFFWSRVGFVLFALSLLLVPVYWEKIRQQTQQANARGGILVLLAKILAGIAAFMLLKATDWGSVAVVQALDGLKFVFIIVLTLLFGRYLPQVVRERDFSSKTIIRKTAYVIIICIGFAFLFV